MAKTDVTTLLPPPRAIWIAWAQTGNFGKEPEPKDIATAATKLLNDVIEKAKEQGDPEKGYVNNAATDLEATMRTMHTIYKGRELNFQEIDKIRSASLENISQDLQFGRNAQDFFKSLPTMAITSGASTITLNKVLESFSLPSWTFWLIGIGSAGLGFFINIGIVRWNSKARQAEYIRQDYERTRYFQHYLIRIRTALLNLYYDIDRLHARYFNKTYPLGEFESAEKIIDNMLQGARPTLCKYVFDHLNRKLIKANLWTLCETGRESCEDCKYWGK
jgi:hypothetical protein